MTISRAAGLGSLVCVLAFSAWAHAAEDSPGLKVGDKAPDFKLQDQLGKDIALKDLLTKGTTAIVFHRSANW